ncbi:MAG: uroporphyrinogen-III synthase [Bacteroidetes bacterium]|nr:MAG: uroporphyrinogen-III synthase [Bacteroidota bacterium]
MKVKNILISQPKPADLERTPYAELIRKFNVNISFEKFIKVEGISSQEFRRTKVSFSNHSAVILTSRHAVDHYFRMAKELRFSIPDTMKYFCISESTAFYLQKYIQYRKRKIFFGKQQFSDLIDIIKKHGDEDFLVPSSDIHKQSMFKLLDSAKIKYTRAVIYKTVAANLSHVDINSFDCLIFFSPAGIKSLQKNFPEYQQKDRIIGAFGRTTTKAVKDANFTLNIPAPTQSAPSMTMALDEFLTKQAKKSRRKK